MGRPVEIKPSKRLGHLEKVEHMGSGHRLTFATTPLPERPETGKETFVTECAHCPERFSVDVHSEEATLGRRFRYFMYGMADLMALTILIALIVGPGVQPDGPDPDQNAEVATWIDDWLVALVLAFFALLVMAVTFLWSARTDDGVTRLRRLKDDGSGSVVPRGHRLV